MNLFINYKKRQMESKEIQAVNSYAFEKLSRFLKIAFLIVLLPLTAIFLSLIPQDKSKLLPLVNDQVNEVKYETFVYLTKETPLYINTITNDSICNISISNNYFENLEITDIIPKPVNVILDHGNKTFSF